MDFEVLLARYVEEMRYTDAEEISGHRFSPELWAKCREDVAAFVAEVQAKNLITDEADWLRALPDFWLTRNGHGCGFWDGDWPEHGDELTDICCKFSVIDLYVGDDGLVYC